MLENADRGRSYVTVRLLYVLDIARGRASARERETHRRRVLLIAFTHRHRQSLVGHWQQFVSELWSRASWWQSDAHSRSVVPLSLSFSVFEISSAIRRRVWSRRRPSLREDQSPWQRNRTRCGGPRQAPALGGLWRQREREHHVQRPGPMTSMTLACPETRADASTPHSAARDRRRAARRASP